MNKCIRVYIKRCKELSDKELNKILKDIQYLTCKASNRAMQMYYMWEQEKIDYKNKYGDYPNEQEQFGKTYRNVVEGKMKSIMNTINTSNVGQTNAFVMKKWNTDRKDILSYRKSLANFKLNMPIYLKNKSYKILYCTKGFELECSLYNREQQKETGLTKLTFIIDKIDSNKRSTLIKLIEGNYKQGAVQIQQDSKNKWFIVISYEFEPTHKELDSNKILGVDLGIVNIATMQIWDKNTKQYNKLSCKECMIDGKELIHYRQRIEARRRSLSIASKYCGEGRIGHGRNTRMKPIDNIGGKISRFKDTYNHKISKYIIDFAIKYNCGTIQMEDLSGFSESQSESLLKNWSYYDLQSKVEYKANEVGIKINFINPQYTSKRCNHCGNIHSENRDCRNNQAKFKCVVCGFEDNADINASKNIAIQDIEQIIKEQLVKQSQN